MEHTPTPYHIGTEETNRTAIFSGEDGIKVAVCNSVPDAAFIVRAVNSHELMVETLQFVLDQAGLSTNSPSYIKIKEAIVKSTK